MYLVVVLVAESGVANVVDERREEVEVGEGEWRRSVKKSCRDSCHHSRRSRHASRVPSSLPHAFLLFLLPSRLVPSILDSGSLLLEPSTVPERMYYEVVPTKVPVPTLPGTYRQHPWLYLLQQTVVTDPRRSACQVQQGYLTVVMLTAGNRL